MLVEITKQDIENLEASVNCAIKSSAILQMIAIMQPDNGMVTLDELLEANVILAESRRFVQIVKASINKREIKKYEQKKE